MQKKTTSVVNAANQNSWIKVPNNNMLQSNGQQYTNIRLPSSVRAHYPPMIPKKSFPVMMSSLPAILPTQTLEGI